jgi:hypothetical protein
MPPADATFEVLADVARELGDDAAAADVTALKQRLDEGRFFVACVGQFKRGKSTLINALVGDAVLPVGVIPVTAVVTVVRNGDARRVRVKTRVADWHDVPLAELASYVAEEQNPDNVKEVLAVEAYVPSPLLASGMCLVDTPGLGSVHASNTAATRDFVPHIDAALVVLGADPPISGEELVAGRGGRAGGRSCRPRDQQGRSPRRGRRRPGARLHEQGRRSATPERAAGRARRQRQGAHGCWPDPGLGGPRSAACDARACRASSSPRQASGPRLASTSRT